MCRCFLSPPSLHPSLCVCVCVCVCVPACVRACVGVCVCTRARVCVRMSLCARACLFNKQIYVVTRTIFKNNILCSVKLICSVFFYMFFVKEAKA